MQGEADGGKSGRAARDVAMNLAADNDLTRWSAKPKKQSDIAAATMDLDEDEVLVQVPDMPK